MRALVALIVMTAIVAAQPQVRRSSGSGVVSPTVVATAVVAYPAVDQAELQLLVLWRGKPGWFTNGRSGSSSGGSSGNGVEAPLVHLATYGDVSLDLSFSAAAHKAIIDGTDVPLPPDDNVILVDDVDSAPRVVRTLHIDSHAQVDSSTRAVPTQEFIKRSPILIDYLQCNIELPGPIQEMMKMICARL